MTCWPIWTRRWLQPESLGATEHREPRPVAKEVLLRGWRALSEGLFGGLPVEARWVPSSVGDEPFVCWPRPGPEDPRSRLALELLNSLRALAVQRQLRVEGATLELFWVERQTPHRQVRARFVIASPEPEAHVRGLAGAVAFESRSAGTLVQHGLELILECHTVNDDAALAPMHFW